MRLSTYITISEKDCQELALCRLHLLKMLRTHRRFLSITDAKNWLALGQFQGFNPDIKICHLDVRITAKVKDGKRWREI